MRLRACSLADIPEDRGHEVLVAGRVVGLFRQDGGVVAVDGLCPHAGGPLATGYCRDGVVMCPWHGWQFSLATGEHCSTPQITVERFDCEVDGDDVFVTIDD